MDMYNEIKFNENYIVDVELLRMESLIENRLAYEEDFLSMAPPADYIICEYENQEYTLSQGLEDDLIDPFELEDYHNQLRDEILIQQREKYESVFFNDYYAVNDLFEFQINARDEDLCLEEIEYDYTIEAEDYIFDQYEEDMFYHLLYLKQGQFEKPDTCSCPYSDYLPNDDGFCDYLDCYDYPEGPDENLAGVKFY